jgi:2-dehydropantoate 2-reductase
MRYIIYGAGAIGATIGARLFESDNEVILIARGGHGRVLVERGLRFGTPEAERTLRIPVVAHPSRIAFQDGDVVFLTMKGQDTAAALRDLAAGAPPDLPVVCAQNGVENERIALRSFAFVHAMCVMLPATYLEAGVVYAHAAPLTGILDLGRYPHGVDEVDRRIADALRRSHFGSEPRADVMRSKYTKLLMNLGNALEAACGRTARRSELFERAKAEAIACFGAAGIAYASDEEDAARRGDLMEIRAVGGVEHRGGSSWQSLARGTGSIEADYLNGEIALLGRTWGIPTPVNALLQRIANRMVKDAIPPGSLRLADLEAEASKAPGASFSRAG